MLRFPIGKAASAPFSGWAFFFFLLFQPDAHKNRLSPFLSVFGWRPCSIDDDSAVHFLITGTDIGVPYSTPHTAHAERWARSPGKPVSRQLAVQDILFSPVFWSRVLIHNATVPTARLWVRACECAGESELSRIFPNCSSFLISVPLYL